jgi:hypothetical protein
MNFEDFKNSPFFINGQIRRSYYSTDYMIVPDVSAYDTTPFIPPTDMIDSVVDIPSYTGRKTHRAASYFGDKGKMFENKPETILNHFFRVISIDNNYLPDEFRLMLYNQWAEVNSVVKKTEATIISSELFVIPPGMGVQKHKHVGVKQTLTFGFKFSDTKISNRNSTLSVWDSNNVEIVFEYPTDKFYFTLDDEIYHSTYCDEWSFFWFFDLDRYAQIQNDIDFTHMNYQSDKYAKRQSI